VLNQVHRDLRTLAWLLGGLRRKLTISRVDGHSTNLRGSIVLATVNALRRSAWSPKDFRKEGLRLGAVILDEPEPNKSDECLELVSRIFAEKAVPLLGLLSPPLLRETPEGTRLLDLFQDTVIYERSFGDLARGGYLARPVIVRRALGWSGDTGFPADDLEASQRAEDITEPLLDFLGNNSLRDQEIVEAFLQVSFLQGRTVVFACSGSHAETLAEQFNTRQVPAVAVHGRLSEEERTSRIRAFRSETARVLVTTGNLAEGEVPPDTRVVLVTRPTTMAARFLRMIGSAARGPRVVPGKDRFVVIDFEDGLEDRGLRLAGPWVTEWLEHSVSVPPEQEIPATEEEEQTRRAAVTSALAWLLLRGFSERGCLLWGELVWQRPEGSLRKVALMPGTIGLVEDGLTLLGQALASEHWSPAEAHALLLEELGAVRSVDWNDMLFDVRRTRILPRLVAIPGLRPDDEDLQAARAMLWLAKAAFELGIATALTLCEELWRDQPLFTERYESAAALKSEILRLYPLLQARLQRRILPEVRAYWDDIEAFVVLGVAVGRADGTLDEAEHGTIVIATGRVFQIERESDKKRAEALIAAVETSALDVERAARRLRARAPWATILAMFDWLLHVAIADGRFVEEERVMLAALAALLGISQEEYRRRCEWYLHIDPSVPLKVTPSTRTCVACGASFPDEARFCGLCGASLGATPSP